MMKFKIITILATVAFVSGLYLSESLGPAYAEGLMLTGPLIKVVYPDRKPEIHRPNEFEVISESR